MGSKYYTHFVAAPPGAPHEAEYTGVVELRLPVAPHRLDGHLCGELARNLDVQPKDIHLLMWARLH